MAAVLIINFDSVRIKIVGGVVFWNVQPYMVQCWQKFQSAIIFFNFWPIAKKRHTLHSLITNTLTMKFGWNQMIVGGGVEFWKS